MGERVVEKEEVKHCSTHTHTAHLNEGSRGRVKSETERG